MNRVLRIKEVKERTGLSTSSIYDLIREGRFPRQVKLGARAVGWLEREIDEWIEERRMAAERDRFCDAVK